MAQNRNIDRKAQIEALESIVNDLGVKLQIARRDNLGLVPTIEAKMAIAQQELNDLRDE